MYRQTLGCSYCSRKACQLKQNKDSSRHDVAKRDHELNILAQPLTVWESLAKYLSSEKAD